jgi:hypothetical protein
VGTAVARSDVMLVVVGRHWLDMRDDQNQRRLDDPSDWVRLEIASALAREMPIIPVLVQGAVMPTSRNLPLPIQPLSRYQAVELHDSSWRADVDALWRLLRAIRGGRPGLLDRLAAVRTTSALRSEAQSRQDPDTARIIGGETTSRSSPRATAALILVLILLIAFGAMLGVLLFRLAGLSE